MRKIAIVEDDPSELEHLTTILAPQGQCVTFRDGQSFLKSIHRETYDLVCVDWNLPEMTGVELISRIRQGALAPTIPIIIITARNTDEDIVKGLVSGADDFVTKPVRQSVLQARVETLLRRFAPPTDETLETFGDYAFDRTRSTVATPQGERLLTTKEFNLAILLFRNIHRPLSRAYLMEEVWGVAANVSSRTLDTHVCRLKTKLGLTPANGFNFSPVYGFGYRLEKMSPAVASIAA